MNLYNFPFAFPYRPPQGKEQRILPPYPAINTYENGNLAITFTFDLKAPCCDRVHLSVSCTSIKLPIPALPLFLPRWLYPLLLLLLLSTRLDSGMRREFEIDSFTVCSQELAEKPSTTIHPSSVAVRPMPNPNKAGSCNEILKATRSTFS